MLRSAKMKLLDFPDIVWINKQVNKQIRTLSSDSLLFVCASVSVCVDRLAALQSDSLHGRDAAGVSVRRSHFWPVPRSNPRHNQTHFLWLLSPLGHHCVPVCPSRYGKRPMLLACLCVHAVCGLVPAVLPQPLLFLAVRCLTGVCCCCINISSFSLGNKTHTCLLLSLLPATEYCRSKQWG